MLAIAKAPRLLRIDLQRAIDLHPVAIAQDVRQGAPVAPDADRADCEVDVGIRLQQVHPDLDPARCAVGVWGRKQALRDALRDRDRVEVYRPLKVDPKEARRLRYRQHLAGLEARRKRPSG